MKLEKEQYMIRNTTNSLVLMNLCTHWIHGSLTSITKELVHLEGGRLDAIPCYEHAGASGAVDANLQELRHQALLSLAWLFCSP
jgi:hypothetical protein